MLPTQRDRARRVLRRCACASLAFGMVFAAGCGSNDQTGEAGQAGQETHGAMGGPGHTGTTSAPPTPEQLADRSALAALIAARHDPVVSVMRDVEAAYERDLPVRAADILQDIALPAAASHLERVRDLELATPEGRALRQSAVTAFTHRREALVGYAAALERGLIEDMVLIDATRALRVAEAEVIAVHQQLAGFPTAPRPASRTP